MIESSCKAVNIKRQIPRHLGVVMLTCDIAALLAAFWCTKIGSAVLVSASHTFDWSGNFHHFDTRRYYYYFLCAFILFFFAYKGHYSRRLPWLAQIETIVKTIFVAALFDGFNYYFLEYRSFPALMVSNWAICFCYLLAGRQLSIRLVSLSKKWKLPIVLVGDLQMVTDCLYAFHSDGMTGYDVKAVLLTRSDGRSLEPSLMPEAFSSINVYDEIAGFSGFIHKNKSFYYIFAMDDLCGDHRKNLNDILASSQVEYAVLPNTKSLEVYGAEQHCFFGNDVMLLHRRDPIRSPSGQFVKRSADIVITVIFLPFLASLCIAVWTAKKIERCHTPLFYAGVRVGRNGSLFKCWKFCTMKEGAAEILEEITRLDDNARLEWDKYKKLKNDPRVDSRISKILRKTSLDELPQLWNVLIGDMSLIGPRPILPDQQESYGVMIQQYKAIRPGLTGLWQVSGRNETSFERRVYWDGWYIRNWSVWYDIVIFFKTVRVFLSGAGAY
ncbi:MAG: hypothetical protein DI626_00405 [Micavibrio aeruginosavorus]|uniref:Bacterial sugar transferase domain-containing protein n=1 Tax=Micavibrio aeruginosavorus TaxID=349221 RepID=A0A2W5A6D3_9BACT|nr:MAG: hypothetical protein DI626_00405 [Micavibrio aeruginosavorus]